MKIRYIVLIISIIFLFGFGVAAKRYIDCSFSLGAGAPSERPEYCDAKQRKAKQQQDQQVSNQFNENMTFQCQHQVRPELSPETQQLYHYAYYHDLHNLWDEKEGVWDQLAHYYRIAAAHGDYKANVRLQYLLEQGRVSSRRAEQEILDLNKELVKQLPATAYYKTYGAVSDGRLETEEYGQYSFLRKAAELGSAEAQFELSNVIMDIQDDATFKDRAIFSKKLEKCSSENGYGRASIFYGLGLRRDKKFTEVLEVFHRGVKQGSNQAALRLKHAFEFKSKSFAPEDVSNYHDLDLDLDLDLERARRYSIIEDYLFTYDYLNPKVTDLDDIVPLPPAKLPAWDGKIAFQRWYEGPSPAKPSDALVEKLAQAKGLDPKTGLALKK